VELRPPCWKKPAVTRIIEPDPLSAATDFPAFGGNSEAIAGGAG
jgi:hypothetical protein